MTEAEWNQCADPLALLEGLPGAVRRRKLVLFAVACCRRLGADLRPSAVRLLEVAEQFADGSLDPSAFREALAAAEADHSGGMPFKGRNHPDRSGLAAVGLLRALAGRKPDATAFGLPPRSGRPVRASLREIQNQLAHRHQQGVTFGAFAEAKALEQEHEAAVLRDLVGPAFAPVALEPGWRRPDVTALAQGVYEERAFDRLPILADALMDAGCDREVVLAHCRGAGPHVRGCWVVDLLLGNR
jgi:hypothetical protein